MVGKRACTARITRDSTVPSPTPASKIRSAGGDGCRLPSSSEIRLATFGLLAAGRDEQEIFLPVVEKPETRRRDVGRGKRGIGRPEGHRRCRSLRRQAGPMLGQIGADLVERPGGDLGAVAQPRYQLAVIDDQPPEGGFGRLRRAAIVPDFPQNLVGSSGGG